MTPTERRTPLSERFGLHRTRALLIALLMVGTATVSMSGGTSVAASDELVTNFRFTEGTTGWKTGRNGQSLTATKVDGFFAVKLGTSKTQSVALNDRVNTVKDSGAAGSKYQVYARVRTDSPTVKGVVRVRELAGGGVTTHVSRFSLGDTAWKTVKLDVTTARPNAELDLHVQAFNLPSGDAVFVEYVSMKRISGGGDAPTPPPPAPTPPPPAPTPTPTDECSNPVPSGTTFGASISAVGQSATESLQKNDARFGKNKVVRDFYPGLPPAWGSSRAKLLAGRDVVMSFKISPQAILSGKHDTFFKNWFATAPQNQTIYWAFHHEPEGEVKKGDFTTTQYRNAWKRLDGFADKACKPNMHATLILSAWTIRPQAGDWHVYDAGKDVIDVIALDPYNRIFEPGSSLYDSPDKILGPIVTAMRADGRPFGVAELGSRIMRDDPNGQRRAQWLRSIGNYAIDNDLTFVSYFQSTRGADWRLLDSASTSVWKSFVTNSPH